MSRELDLRKRLDLEKEELLLRELERKLKQDLGYKYAHPIYVYQRQFINSTNKMNLLVACNQGGKSTSGILRCCHRIFTTDEERVKLFGEQFVPGRDKLLIWYLYPDYKTANTAFQTTWQKYLPKGIYLEDEKLKEQYWWEPFKVNREIGGFNFRDGILQFKVYGQSAMNIQSATVYEVTSDEEMPFDLYPEIRSRLNFTNGTFNMVFTATRGEPEWYRAMEKQGDPSELFPNAKKWNVSLWHLLKYEDGTKSPWTKERIIQISNQYGTEEEVQRRVEGRFVMETSQLVLSSFHQDLVVKPYPLPTGWQIYCGIDIGSGGVNHKSAIAFTAVSPDRKQGVVFATWRGEEVTTEKDVLMKYKEMVRKMPHVPITFYDHSAKDFIKVVNEDETYNMFKAEKSFDYGIGVFNSLMKNKKLTFFDTEDNQKLFQEIRLTRNNQPKRKRRDDVIDAVRFSITKVNWDWSDVKDYELIENPAFRFANKVKNEVHKLYDEYGEYNPPRDLKIRQELKEQVRPDNNMIDQEFDEFIGNDIFDF